MVCSLPCFYKVLDKSCAFALLHQLQEEIWILSLEKMVSGMIFTLLFFKTSYIAQYAMQLVILTKKTHANMHMYTNRHIQTNFFVLFLAWGLYHWILR